MGSSSANSSGSAKILNSGSESDLQELMNERKRKRMESNRESARRSRMRKQKHLDDLMAQVTQLRDENNQILNSINVTTEHHANVEAENSVLRAQMMELSHRLDSLNEIISYINNSNNVNHGSFETFEDNQTCPETFVNNPWNFTYLNQPIMASADMLYQY